MVSYGTEIHTYAAFNEAYNSHWALMLRSQYQTDNGPARLTAGIEEKMC